MRAIKKLFSETYPQIKFEDGSVKQNFLVVCTGLALAPFSGLKWPIKKKSGKIPWTPYIIFSVQGRNGEWRWFFRFLRLNLM